ncbi:MAG: 5-formyltetrahydrofolate cyclo-ligase [Lachnospiraceae bacterium]|nr:5-formyltetrahydrofolate cyclo-ligase [Lachnospiraceae bacterium]
MDTKSSLRRQLIALRKDMPEEQRCKEATDICDYLLRTKMLQETDVVMLYAAKSPEVTLDAVFAWALAQDKMVCFPRVSGEEMDFYYVENASDLIPGNFGVREPAAYCQLATFTKAVCVVPGVAFDKTGNRMGYGKGYYDRYLSRSTAEIYKIGVCYDEQLQDEIPAMGHDIKMDLVVSASNVIDIVTKKGQQSIWI